jgi:hypothetical protein
MMTTERGVRIRKARLTTELVQDLNRSRNQLQHLIYSMEHDRSLNAETTRISVLKELLSGIEEKLGTFQLER